MRWVLGFFFYDHFKSVDEMAPGKGQYLKMRDAMHQIYWVKCLMISKRILNYTIAQHMATNAWKHVRNIERSVLPNRIYKTFVAKITTEIMTTEFKF